jgi:hypothetical protein
LKRTPKIKDYLYEITLAHNEKVTEKIKSNNFILDDNVIIEICNEILGKYYLITNEEEVNEWLKTECKFSKSVKQTFKIVAQGEIKNNTLNFFITRRKQLNRNVMLDNFHNDTCHFKVVGANYNFLCKKRLSTIELATNFIINHNLEVARHYDCNRFINFKNFYDDFLMISHSKLIDAKTLLTFQTRYLLKMENEIIAAHGKINNLEKQLLK